MSDLQFLTKIKTQATDSDCLTNSFCIVDGGCYSMFTLDVMYICNDGVCGDVISTQLHSTLSVSSFISIVGKPLFAFLTFSW